MRGTEGREPPALSSRTDPKVPLITAGVVALVLGIGFLGWGVAPAKGFAAAGDAFGGGAPSDPEAITGSIDAAMAGLQGRAWATILGVVLILGGIITAKMAGPRDKSVQQQVKEAVDAELAQREPTHEVTATLPVPPGSSGVVGSAPGQAPLTRASTPMEERRIPAGSGLGPAPPHPVMIGVSEGLAAVGTRCTTCGSIKVAAGRICPRCG